MSKRPSGGGANLSSRITGKAGKTQVSGLRLRLLSHLAVQPTRWEEGAVEVGDHLEGQLTTAAGTSAGLCFWRVLSTESFLTTAVLTVRILGTTDTVFRQLILDTCADRTLLVHLCCQPGKQCAFAKGEKELYHCRTVKLFPVGVQPHYGRNLTGAESGLGAVSAPSHARAGDFHMQSLADLAKDLGAGVGERPSARREGPLDLGLTVDKEKDEDKAGTSVPQVPPPLPAPPGLAPAELRIKPGDIAEEVTFRSRQANVLEAQARRKLKKKKKDRDKKKKKKKKKGSTSSDGSSSSESSSDTSLELLSEANKLRKLARDKPGHLTLNAITEMKELIEKDGHLAPLAAGSPFIPLYSKYYQLVLEGTHDRLGQRSAREAKTLAYIADAIIQGRIPQALDILTQRFKALEASALPDSGGWMVARHLELVPESQTGVSGLRELEAATQMELRVAKMRERLQRRNAPRQSGAGSGNQGQQWRGKGGGRARQTSPRRSASRERPPIQSESASAPAAAAPRDEGNRQATSPRPPILRTKGAGKGKNDNRRVGFRN